MKQEQNYQECIEAAHFLRNECDLSPDFAFILGSGFSELSEYFGDEIFSIDYKDIPYFPVPQVPGHPGKLSLLDCDGIKLAFFLGRPHLYEGFSAAEVAFPVRLNYEWGNKNLILLNAVGSLNDKIKVGDFVLVHDHINFTGQNPLMGQNWDFWGARFPAMDLAYHTPLRQELWTLPGNRFKEGVYFGVNGPSYETSSEIRAFQKMGGDVVGMSAVMEALASVHLDMNFALVSVVTNHCLKPERSPQHEDVLEEVQKLIPELYDLFQALMNQQVGDKI